MAAAPTGCDATAGQIAGMGSKTGAPESRRFAANNLAGHTLEVSTLEHAPSEAANTWIAHVVIVADEGSFLASSCSNLADHGHDWQVSVHTSAQAAIDELRTLAHAVVLSERHMEGASNTTLCQWARDLMRDPDSRLRALYFVSLGPATRDEHVREAIEQRVDDYLTMPCSREELVARIQIACRSCRALHYTALLEQQLRDLATIDPLTHLNNRRGARERIEAELAKADRGNQVVTLAVCKLSGLAEINADFGYGIGDRVLQELSKVTRTVLRRYDIAVRWEDGKFLLVLPGARALEAEVVVGRIRELLERRPVLHSRGQLKIEFRAGMCSTDDHAKQPFSELLELAERALALAREDGRSETRVADAAWTAPGIVRSA